MCGRSLPSLWNDTKMGNCSGRWTIKIEDREKRTSLSLGERAVKTLNNHGRASGWPRDGDLRPVYTEGVLLCTVYLCTRYSVQCTVPAPECTVHTYLYYLMFHCSARQCTRALGHLYSEKFVVFGSPVLFSATFFPDALDLMRP